MKILRAIGGTLAGYLISAVSSLAWFFRLTHHDPWQPASIVFIAASAVFGVVFSVIAGFTGATIARGSERGVGLAIAIIILLTGAWSWWESPDSPHWSQIVAVVLMGPAAILGARLVCEHRLPRSTAR
jgi:protein-S-isoprenylcysteine O-methyltransferase Ste14